jgi:hypothetical protein
MHDQAMVGILIYSEERWLGDGLRRGKSEGARVTVDMCEARAKLTRTGR